MRNSIAFSKLVIQLLSQVNMRAAAKVATGDRHVRTGWILQSLRAYLNAKQLNRGLIELLCVHLTGRMIKKRRRFARSDLSFTPLTIKTAQNETEVMRLV